MDANKNKRLTARQAVAKLLSPHKVLGGVSLPRLSPEQIVRDLVSAARAVPKRDDIRSKKLMAEADAVKAQVLADKEVRKAAEVDRLWQWHERYHG